MAVVEKELDDVYEGLVRQLSTMSQYAAKYLTAVGVKVGGEVYKADMKAVTLNELNEVLMHLFLGDCFFDKRLNFSKKQLAIATKYDVLCAEYLIELTNEQIRSLDRINNLKVNDAKNNDVLRAWPFGALLNEAFIRSLWIGLTALPGVTVGAISMSQRERRQGIAEKNKKLVEKAARKILQEDNVKSYYLYEGGKRNGQIKVRSLAKKIAEELDLKPGTIETHLRPLNVKKNFS